MRDGESGGVMARDLGPPFPSQPIGQKNWTDGWTDISGVIIGVPWLRDRRHVRSCRWDHSAPPSRPTQFPER